MGVCFVQGMDHIDPKDAFVVEMCIGLMRKCGCDIPVRNNYLNMVKKRTHEHRGEASNLAWFGERHT